MGDRALIQFECKDELSPVVYLHWEGSRVRQHLETLSKLMEGREGDVSYACARFIGICHEAVPGHLSLGVWNEEKRLTADDTHGDAGCFVVNVSDYSVETFGGYGFGEDSGAKPETHQLRQPADFPRPMGVG